MSDARAPHLTTLTPSERRSRLSARQRLTILVVLLVFVAVCAVWIKVIKDNGRMSTCSTDVVNVNTAIAAFYAQKGHYPNSDSDLLGGRFLPGQTLPADVRVDYTARPPAVSGTSC